jgi:hypothetical protein
MTARTLLYLLQPELEEEVKELMEAERIEGLGNADLEMVERLSSTENSTIAQQRPLRPSPTAALSPMHKRSSVVPRKISTKRGSIIASQPALVSQERELIKVRAICSPSSRLAFVFP